ncbi:Hypothetical protein SMAX5B_005502 [Scophthalmus maximus]|uniref:Uncharacterized protein n=1 Tax=Scophthalmus maximus TaxID=52904 RepID=A0A2U9B1V5_SCOMX|nr:Hypothetical protein SMAX5B_005502 [Scophthalmus maximus]
MSCAQLVLAHCGRTTGNRTKSTEDKKKVDAEPQVLRCCKAVDPNNMASLTVQYLYLSLARVKSWLQDGRLTSGPSVHFGSSFLSSGIDE